MKPIMLKVPAWLFTVLALGLSGCVTTQKGVALSHPDRPHAYLMIFRQDSMQANLADAYIGLGDQYFAQLGEQQYTLLELDSGLHQLRAKAHASVSSKTHINLAENETTCMEARPNHEDLHLLVIPFLNALVPSFILEETQCPGADQLKNMTEVQI